MPPPTPVVPVNPVSPASGSNPSGVNPPVGTTSANTVTTTQPQARLSGIAGNYVPSTIRGSRLDPRSGPTYTPLTITITQGTHANQVLDLGVNVFELSESQNANWEDNQSLSIRVGSNFKNLSPRTFTFSLDFAHETEDIRQLVENVAHIQEITSRTLAPPYLQVRIGLSTIFPVVCTSFEPKYDSPLPFNKGFRHATVNLTLKLIGGKGSIHQLGPPLASTPLSDYGHNTSVAEQNIQGSIGAAQALLIPCLGQSGSDEITNLIKNNQLSDVAAILKLSPKAFVEMAIAGIDPKVLKYPAIQVKLSSDLALVMAQNEPGISTNNFKALADALISGDPSHLPSNLTTTFSVTESDGTTNTTTQQSIYSLTSRDYGVILAAIQSQKLNPTDPIFDSKNVSGSSATALKRLNNIGSCGLSLRVNGSPTVGNVTESEANLLSTINNTVNDSSISDKQLALFFGLAPNTPKTVIDKIRNSGPYTDKNQFIANASNGQSGYTGYTLWSGFDKVESNAMSAANALLNKPGVTDNDIKKAFNLNSDTEASAIKGQSFNSKADLLLALASANSGGSSTDANKYWLAFKKGVVLPGP